MTEVTKVKVNDDLQKERETCEFNVEELTHFLDGGSKFTDDRRKAEKEVLSVKGIIDEVPEEYLSHKEKYENAIRKSVLYFKKMNEIQSGRSEPEKLRLSSRISSAVFKDNHPFSLHFSMFIPAILGQANEEQQKYWLRRAQKMDLIGTYAQTELGHGTFIRGLETTATYDEKTEEFILNSPTLSSYKWWPGSLAHTANHCVVMAQLSIKGKKYGIQPFMVQLRDEESHLPLPGIKLGEIGAKLGFNTVNNGFLGFDHHRIKRERMLMKNAQVLKDGTFIPSRNSKLTYGTMVFVRVVIVNSMASHLAKAVTIAIRYAAVRRQSQPKPGEPEPQILDYLTQQHKLFICIATSHAFSIAAEWLWKMYSKVIKDLASGDTEDLPELHALACCLKAVSSSEASSLIEKCRLSCGGHGYMLSSNLPQQYGLATAACTYEGENTVLHLQTARSLVKAYLKASSGKPLTVTTAYLSDKSPLKPWDGSVDGIVKSFQRIAAGKIKSAVTNLNKYSKSGLSKEDAWNMTSVQLVAASEAHCRAVILSVYKSEIDNTTGSLSPSLRKVLQQLVKLYATYWSLERVGELLLYASISEKDIQELQHSYEQQLLDLRRNAVGLVDGFDFSDEVLNSALGAYDGRVYERLMAEAMKSPLNHEPVNQSFHKYLKPFMQGKL